MLLRNALQMKTMSPVQFHGPCQRLAGGEIQPISPPDWADDQAVELLEIDEYSFQFELLFSDIQMEPYM